MIAFSTVLSLFKLIEMPYGGSVTLASMLPMVILSYRNGILWGLGAGGVYAAIQQLLGLNNLSYVTGWQSVVAVILLDYMLAFMAVAVGGVFRGVFSREKGIAYGQGKELALGMVFVCVIRYFLHTVAGATVWAGLSIPSTAALIYSLGYNATYMIPETVVNTAVAAYLGSVIDFSKQQPTRFSITAKLSQPEVMAKAKISRTLAVLAASIITGAVIADTVIIFPHLQNAETGEFTFANLYAVSWLAVIIVSAVCILAAASLAVAAKLVMKRTDASADE